MFSPRHGVVAALAFIAGLVSFGSGVAVADGDLLYDRYCATCHGETGDGQGVAAAVVWPVPRNFRKGDYKWRTTASGQAPTAEDLRRTILRGVPGTSMPGFEGILTLAQVDELIGVLRSFAPKKFGLDSDGTAQVQMMEALVSTDWPPHSEERGKQLYQDLGCAHCHGETLAGDGPSAAELRDEDGLSARPYNLLRAPIRRPSDANAMTQERIFRSLVTGLSGTPMPSYDGAASYEDLKILSLYVAGKVAKAQADSRSLWERIKIPKQAIVRDKLERLMRGGYAPKLASLSAHPFANALLPQGTPPTSLTPAQVSLDARQCARCHDKQYRQWRKSVHAKAGSPGLIAQLLEKERNKKWVSLQSCQRCHNPLAEQSPVLSAAQSGKSGYSPNKNYSPALREQGLNCASCHVRQWTRHGPPKRTDGGRLALPSYPVKEERVYERSDMCMPCHQLPSRISQKGRPLLNTYKEWLEGPYMPRGVQCQHCHMPDRDHTFRGVHDPETFAQGISVRSISQRNDRGIVSVRARVYNVGAGHFLPTTPTPAAFLSIRLVDGSGKSIPGAFAEKRIGRHLRDDLSQIEDTRIPQGEYIELAAAWKDGRVPEARNIRVRVRVEPDEYYERFYLRKLRRKDLSKEERQLYKQALKGTRDSHYVVFEESYPIGKRDELPVRINGR